MPTSKDALAGRVAEMTLALICVRFGDADRGIPGLERLLKLPGGRPPVTLATLRNDPRFQKLCEGKQP